MGAAVLNYIDRQSLSALAPTIQASLGFDDRDYANLVNLFLLAYTLSYLVVGGITDRLGTRAAMGWFVGFWSVANALTGFAGGLRSLGAFRFSLGLSEAGVWPAAAKAVSEWFPARERALAIGLYTMGATLGATLAPYVVIRLAGFDYATHWPALAGWLGQDAGWRLAFMVTGLAGFLWLGCWLIFYRPPENSPLLMDQERELILAGRDEGETPDAAVWTLRQVLGSRAVWALLLARLVTDPVWYFFQFWFAKYLNSARGLGQSQLTVTWIVYAAAGVGSLAGGWWSGRLIRRGQPVVASRLWVMLGCALLMPVSLFIARAPSLGWALVLAAVAVFAALAWLINLSALVNDLIPRRSLGVAFSVIAAGSTVGGMVMNTLVGVLVSSPSATMTLGFLDRAVHAVSGGLLQAIQGSGYPAAFLVMAFLHPLALLPLWPLRRAKARA